jgi:hypothetical protein
MIATLTAIRVPVKIVAPYPGKYLELTGFSASNANIGEDAKFVVSATSWGTDVISSAKAKIDVYDFNEKYLTSVDTDEITDIQPEQEVDLSSFWNTAGMTRGVYSAKATITYDGTTLESDKAEFRVGELLVSLVNYTNSIELGGLKPMTINIKNEWSGPISNVYATVTLNNAEFKTAPVDMRAFENGVLSAYIDTTNFKAGTTHGKLSLYYGDNKKSTAEDIAVTFVEPQKTSEFNMIYVIVILLVIIIFIMLLLFLRKGKNEYKKRRR